MCRRLWGNLEIPSACVYVSAVQVTTLTDNFALLPAETLIVIYLANNFPPLQNTNFNNVFRKSPLSDPTLALTCYIKLPLGLWDYSIQMQPEH